MESNWERSKKRSLYHFNTSLIDYRFDNVQGLGKFVGSWDDELKNVIANSTPTTWKSRGYAAKQHVVSPELEDEEYDLVNAGCKADLIICHMNFNIPPVFQKMADRFCLEHAQTRLHTHVTGDVFTIHLDKFPQWYPGNEGRAVRFVVNLTDWEVGHFSQFGNFNYSHWGKGDIITFNINTPHCAANASLLPRVVLVVTGLHTEQTDEFLKELANTKAVTI